jgi:hypothetical protein
MLKSRNTSQRTKHQPLGVDSTLRTRIWLLKLTLTTEQSPIHQRGSAWCGVYARLKSRLVNPETNDSRQYESQYVHRTLYMTFDSPSITTSWATPWRVHKASLNGTCLTQSRADHRHGLPKVARVSHAKKADQLGSQLCATADQTCARSALSAGYEVASQSLGLGFRATSMTCIICRWGNTAAASSKTAARILYGRWCLHE